MSRVYAGIRRILGARIGSGCSFHDQSVGFAGPDIGKAICRTVSPLRIGKRWRLCVERACQRNIGFDIVQGFLDFISGRVLLT